MECICHAKKKLSQVLGFFVFFLAHLQKRRMIVVVVVMMLTGGVPVQFPLSVVVISCGCWLLLLSILVSVADFSCSLT